MESETGATDSDFESFALTKKVLGFEKWISLLRKRATKYPRSRSAMTITSPLHEAIEFHDQSTSQKEVRRPIGIKIERKHASNHNAERKDSLLSPSSDIADSDWDLLESGNDSESIFRFSPDDHNISSNGKPTSSSDNAVGEHQVCMSPTEGAHKAFRNLSSLSLQSTNKDIQGRSNVLEPGEGMRGDQSRARLLTIFEEPQGQIEVENRQQWTRNST